MTIQGSVQTWIDAGSRERLTLLWSASGASDTLDLLRVMSNATVTTISEGDLTATGAAVGAPTAWAEASDLMILSVEDAFHVRCHLFIPSPVLSLLQADRINADPATTEWTNLEADLSGMSVPYSGLPIVTLLAATVAFNAPKVFETFNNYNTGLDWRRRSLFWRDSLGYGFLSHLCGPPAGTPDLAGIMAEFQAVSTANITHYIESDMSVFTDTPTTDLYNSVHDYAVFTFADEDGTQTSVMLPAPALPIFLPDGKTVDSAQANVDAFITQAMLDLVVPSSGKPVVTYLGGQLHRTVIE